MTHSKPRTRVAIAHARNIAASLIKNVESCWQQEGTSLSDDEMVIVEKELARISARIERTINQEALCLVAKSREGSRT